MSLHYFGLQKPVFARSGWEVPQPNPLVLEKHQLPEDLIRIRTVSLVDDLTRKGKTGLRIRSVSEHLYDCVGMIFSNRRAWININHIHQLLTEDGYATITLDQLAVGDVVVYRLDGRPIHVGLVTYVHPSVGNIANIRVLSKWGKFGEVEHRMDDVPDLCGEPSEFWSEKAPHDIGQVFSGN